MKRGKNLERNKNVCVDKRESSGITGSQCEAEIDFHL